jgi:hypothetical protein
MDFQVEKVLIFGANYRYVFIVTFRQCLDMSKAELAILLKCFTYLNWCFALLPYLTFTGVWLLTRRAEMMRDQFPFTSPDDPAHIRFHDAIFQTIEKFSTLAFAASAYSL